jgi:putative solute:sodium symporter small subunit
MTMNTAHSAPRSQLLSKYWKKNIRVVLSLLTVWATASLGCGVLFADYLNSFTVGGFPLGFWFAQQGSIIVFVFLILIYAILLNRLDRWYADELKSLSAETTTPKVRTEEDAG